MVNPVINGRVCMCVSDGDGMDRDGQPWVSTVRDSVSSVFARTTAIVNGLVCDWHRRVCLSSPSSSASSLRKPHPPSLVYKISSHLAFAFFLSQAAWTLLEWKKAMNQLQKCGNTTWHAQTCSLYISTNENNNKIFLWNLTDLIWEIKYDLERLRSEAGGQKEGGKVK